MGWVKEANKIGRYETTHKGFRIYFTKEPVQHESIVERNGEYWRQTDLIPGDIIAIDKDGFIIEGHYLDSVGYKIDIEMIRRFYQ